MRDRYRFILALGVAFLIAGSFQGRAQALKERQEEVNRLVVHIVDENQQTMGAGIIFGVGKNDLYIATANHVVRRRIDDRPRAIRLGVEIRGGTKILRAVLLSTFNKYLDLAVLKVPNLHFANLESLFPLDRLGDPNTLRFGDALHVVGHPRGETWDVHVDPFPFKVKKRDNLEFETTLLQPGHSGGGLFNERWELVGMVKSHTEVRGIATRIDVIIKTLRAWGYPVSLYQGSTKKSGYPCPGTVIYTVGGRLDQVRTMPSKEAVFLPKQVQQSEVVEIQRSLLVEGRTWYQIVYQNGTLLGWILSDFIIPSSSCP